MGPDRKGWRILGVAFILGVAMGGVFIATVSWTSIAAEVPWPLQWVMVPGFILVAPIYVLTGGVHGSYVEMVFWSVLPANGIAYALIAALIRRMKLARSKKASRAE